MKAYGIELGSPHLEADIRSAGAINNLIFPCKMAIALDPSRACGVIVIVWAHHDGSQGSEEVEPKTVRLNKFANDRIQNVHGYTTSA